MDAQFMAQSSRRVVWARGYDPETGETEAERKEAVRHLSAKLLEIWLYEPNPSSPENKARRKAICKKLKEWGRAK